MPIKLQAPTVVKNKTQQKGNGISAGNVKLSRAVLDSFGLEGHQLANLISYTTDCPKCKENNVEAKLSLDLDRGKIVCGSNAAHEFDELPDETAPVLGEVRPSETNKLEDVACAELAKTEQRIDAASGQSRMVEIMAERVPQVAVKPPMFIIPPAAKKELAVMDFKPSRVGIPARMDAVGLGESVILPGGDALCGIRVSEAWVSAMKAIGEESKPVRSVADVLQERIDQGLLEWYGEPMQTK